MDRRLVDVSQAGNIEAFHALLEDEPRVLDFIDEVPFTRTPLHIAIIAQKWDFAKEIARLKPSFITQIDSYGYNPLHLAAEKGQVEILRDFLGILQPEIKFMQGKENRTPLHFAVISGEVEAVSLLLHNYPDCILDLTVKDETALHLAVKNRQLGCFLLLLEWLKWACQVMAEPCGVTDVRAVKGLLNWKDEDGNNVLHLATMTKQYEMIEALLSSFTNPRSGIKVEVNAMNGKSLTSLDILLQFPKEKRDAKTEEILLKFGAKTTTQMLSPLQSSASNMPNYPSPARRSLVFGLDIVFAIAMVITCLLVSACVDFHPLMVFSMVGFLLSFTLFVAVSMASRTPMRKIIVIVLAAVLGSYVYLVFSSIPGKDRLLFGVMFMNIGAAISMVYAKLEGVLYNKGCDKEVKLAGSNGYAEV